MNRVATLLAATILVGCGGGGEGGKGEAAAAACDAYAKGQLGDKTYSLDAAVLAKSIVPHADGTHFLKGPIVVEPGLAGEIKQTLECSVRFTEGKPTPDVIKMQFIW